jgi:hypothetical protein
MPSFENFFPLLPLAIFAFFGYRYFKNGSLVGALLGGRVGETLGEVALASGSFTSRVLKVQLLDDDNSTDPSVILVLTSKAPLAASVAPIKMSRNDARTLAELLMRASGPRGTT